MPFEKQYQFRLAIHGLCVDNTRPLSALTCTRVQVCKTTRVVESEVIGRGERRGYFRYFIVITTVRRSCSIYRTIATVVTCARAVNLGFYIRGGKFFLFQYVIDIERDIK